MEQLNTINREINFYAKYFGRTFGAIHVCKIVNCYKQQKEVPRFEKF